MDGQWPSSKTGGNCPQTGWPSSQACHLPILHASLNASSSPSLTSSASPFPPLLLCMCALFLFLSNEQPFSLWAKMLLSPPNGHSRVSLASLSCQCVSCQCLSHSANLCRFSLSNLTHDSRSACKASPCELGTRRQLAQLPDEESIYLNLYKYICSSILAERNSNVSLGLNSVKRPAPGHWPAAPEDWPCLLSPRRRLDTNLERFLSSFSASRKENSLRTAPKLVAPLLCLRPTLLPNFWPPLVHNCAHKLACCNSPPSLSINSAAATLKLAAPSRARHDEPTDTRRAKQTGHSPACR